MRKALAPALGESLLGLDLDELTRRAEEVPMVAAASFDRAFPHTLAIAVVPELPVAVLRQGSSSWLVAGRRPRRRGARQGRAPGPAPHLAEADRRRRVGERTGRPQRRALAAVAPLVRASASRPPSTRLSSAAEGLTLDLRSGLEVRLGDASDLAVKLEVVRRVLPSSAVRAGYLDVSVPERPVAGEPSTLRSRSRLQTRSLLEIPIDSAEKETYAARGKERGRYDAQLELQVERDRDTPR